MFGDFNLKGLRQGLIHKKVHHVLYGGRYCAAESYFVLAGIIQPLVRRSSLWTWWTGSPRTGSLAGGALLFPSILDVCKGPKKGKKLSLLVSGAIFLICWITWYLPIGADMRAKLIVIPSIAFFWMVGCVFYELPAFLWSRRK